MVIVADTADRAGGSDEMQTTAIAALNQIARVDVTAPDARIRINEVLSNALAAAERAVADLERRLAAAQAALALGHQEATATETITSLQANLIAARSSLNALTARFGSSPGGPSARSVSTTYHPRRTGATIWFGSGFQTTGSGRTAYTVVNRGAAPTDGFDLTPDGFSTTRRGATSGCSRRPLRTRATSRAGE